MRSIQSLVKELKRAEFIGVRPKMRDGVELDYYRFMKEEEEKCTYIKMI